MKKTLLFLLFLPLFQYISAQILDKTNMRLGEDVEYCGQHKKQAELMKDPNFKAQYEAEQLKLKDIERNLNAAQSRNKRTGPYIIPVVFHIIHKGGVENINNSQIQNAIDVLNRDYQMKNADVNSIHPDFKGLPAPLNVQFVLATKAPDGTCFQGVTRTYSTDTTTNGYKQLTIIKNENDVYKGDWTGNQYLNVFVCSNIGGPAGYTFNPSGSGKSMSNGIWILHTYVGEIGTGSTTRGRALTHEIGHWLNLSHTWGPNNSPGDPTSCNIDDDVDDTPNTIGVTWCNLEENTCGPRANVENYMDYSYCSKMFTLGQVNRMNAALNSDIGGRNNIWNPTNLAAVGAINPPLCSVGFTPSSINVCLNSVVNFTDNSFNAPTSWKWLFPGGIPESSTEQNPSVVYTKPGVYSVSLTVSNGTSMLTSVKKNLINVYGQAKAIPFLESFEDYSSISKNPFWTVNNPGNNQAFEIYNGTGNSGSKCLKLGNYLDKNKNIDELISGSFDLSKIKNQADITLSYRYAYRKTSSSNSEALRVSISSDCGLTWTSKRVLIGNSLDTAVITSNWTPNKPTDWKTVHVTNISSAFWTSDTRIKFSFESNGGNNIYIDDINLYPSGPKDTLIASAIDTILPQVLTSINFEPSQPISCKNTDITFFDKSIGNATSWSWSFPGGNPTSSIERNPTVSYSSAGVHDVTLTATNGNSTKTLIKNAIINIANGSTLLPFSETFENYNTLSDASTWTVINNDKNKSFALTDTVALQGKKCIKIERFKDTLSSNDVLISSPINLSQIKDSTLVEFGINYAYRKNNINSNDSLSIYFSNDCALNWNLIKTISGDSLAKEIETNNWIPTKNDWKNLVLNPIGKFYWKTNVRFKIEFKGNGGNNFYLDSIRFVDKDPSKPTTNINENVFTKFAIYPNPTEDILYIQLETLTDRKISYTVFDVYGKKIVESGINAQKGDNIITLNTNQLAKGSYFIKINTEETNSTHYFQVR